MVFEALVIGGGINGLSSLYHLLKLGLKRVALVERNELGHYGGSSHGSSRIIRTTYADPDYVRLMRVVREQEWPRLEREAGEPLVFPVPGCFFGPPGHFDQYVEAVAAAGADVDELDIPAARKTFPQFHFEGVRRVLSDRTAGIVAAATTMQSLARFCRSHGAEMFERTSVQAIDFSADLIRVVSPESLFQTERLIVAAGPWIGELIPPLREHLRPRRQTIAYFTADGAADRALLQRLPVWASIANPPEGISYGLPPFQGSGCKIARHLTGGADDDPNIAQPPTQAALAELEQIAARTLSIENLRMVEADVCFYTNTASEDFVLDFLPDCHRVLIAAACSGHAFKFAPLTGRVIAELAVHGRSTSPEFESMRQRFSVAAAAELQSR